jgi:hypothetical protein
MKVDFGDEDLKKFKRKAKKLNGEKQVPLPKLLTPNFLKGYSDFKSLNEMRDTYFVEAIKNNSDEFVKFLSAHTKFSTLEDMLREATIFYTKSELNL